MHKQPYRIRTRLVAFETGRRCNKLVLEVGGREEVSIYVDLTADGGGNPGNLWGFITLRNPAFPYGGRGVSIAKFDCLDMLEQALGKLDFGRATLQQQAA